MTRRLARPLSILALLLPVPSLAQQGTVTLNPVTVGRTDCASDTTVGVRWTYTGTKVGSGDCYRVTAVGGSSPACATTPPFTGGVGTLGNDVLASTPNPALAPSPSTADIQAAISAADGGVVTCSDVSDSIVVICVYYVPVCSGNANAVQVGSANFTFQNAIPPPPVGVNAGAANAAIDVSYSAGTKGGNYLADSVTYAAETVMADADGGVPDGGWVRTSASTNNPIRVGGLTNNTPYYARVLAFSSQNNEGPASAPTPYTTTPLPFDDFWTRYKNSGGREEGGCGAGGTGALALLVIVLAVLVRRRT